MCKIMYNLDYTHLNTSGGYLVVATQPVSHWCMHHKEAGSLEQRRQVFSLATKKLCYYNEMLGSTVWPRGGFIKSFAVAVNLSHFSWWQVAEIISKPSHLMTCWPQDMSECKHSTFHPLCRLTGSKEIPLGIKLWFPWWPQGTIVFAVNITC